MSKIVGDRSNTGIDEVTNHADVGEEDAGGKYPEGVAEAVERPYGGEEHGKLFEL